MTGSRTRNRTKKKRIISLKWNEIKCNNINAQHQIILLLLERMSDIDLQSIVLHILVFLYVIAMINLSILNISLVSFFFSTRVVKMSWDKKSYLQLFDKWESYLQTFVFFMFRPCGFKFEKWMRSPCKTFGWKVNNALFLSQW